MATLNPEVKIEQSGDCKTLTITDDTNWSDNTEGYLKSDFTRTVILRDGNDVVIGTKVIPGDTDSIEFAQDKDIVAKIQFTIDGVADYSIERIYQLTCRVDLLFENITRKTGCSCGHKETNYSLNNARNLLTAALTNGKYGDHELAQDKIQKAAIILEDHNCNC